MDGVYAKTNDKNHNSGSLLFHLNGWGFYLHVVLTLKYTISSTVTRCLKCPINIKTLKTVDLEYKASFGKQSNDCCHCFIMMPTIFAFFIDADQSVANQKH